MITETIPADLLAYLDAHKPARTVFEALPPSHRREYVKWIEAAKRPETRQRRIAETARKLQAQD